MKVESKMNFKNKLLFTSFMVLTLQGIYAADRPRDEDWDKNKKTTLIPNLGMVEPERLRQETEIRRKQYREPTNAFEAIDRIRQKKGYMHYGIEDVEDGLNLIHSFIASGEEIARIQRKENNYLKKKISDLEYNLILRDAEHKRLIEEKNIIEKKREEYLIKIDTLQRFIEEKNSHCNRLESNFIKANEDSEFLKEENQRKNKEYQERQQDLNDEIKHLNNQLKEKVELLTKNQKALNSVENKLSNILKEKERLLIDIKEKEKEIIDFQSSSKNFQEIYFTTKRDRDQLEQEKILLSNQLMYTQSELNEKERFIQRGTNYVVNLDRDKKEFQEKAKKKEFQLDNTEEKLKVFQDLSKQREEEIFKKDELIKSLKEEIGQKQERISILENENSVKDQIPLLRGNLITILSILGKHNASDNLMELSTDLMQAVISKLSQK